MRRDGRGVRRDGEGSEEGWETRRDVRERGNNTIAGEVGEPKEFEGTHLFLSPQIVKQFTNGLFRLTNEVGHLRNKPSIPTVATAT